MKRIFKNSFININKFCYQNIESSFSPNECNDQAEVFCETQNDLNGLEREVILNEENDDICQLLRGFDQKCEHKEWVDYLSENSLFSPTELKRVGVLLSMLQYQIEKTPKTKGYFESILKSFDSFLSEEIPTKNSSNNVRNLLVQLEKTLCDGSESMENFRLSEKDKIIIKTRENIGLALGGGGLTGFSHIGVLSVFEKAGIPINMISGVSMGALIGSMAAAFIDENGEISREGISYMEEVVSELRTLDDIREKNKSGKMVIPLDKILYIRKCNPTLSPQIPLFIQVKKESNGEILFFEPTTEEESKLMASASAANGKVFDMDPVEIDGELYSDDLGTAKKSTGPGMEKLSNSGARTVIDVGISYIDVMENRSYSDAKYRSDDSMIQYVKVKPLEKRGFGSNRGKNSAGLTTTGVGEWFFKIGGKQIARNEKDLENGRIPIPVEEYLKAGRKAGEKMLPEIFKKIGLSPLTKEFCE